MIRICQSRSGSQSNKNWDLPENCDLGPPLLSTRSNMHESVDESIRTSSFQRTNFMYFFNLKICRDENMKEPERHRAVCQIWALDLWTVCVFVCQPVCLSDCQSLNLSLCLSCLSLSCVCLCQYVCFSVCLSQCFSLSACLPVCCHVICCACLTANLPVCLLLPPPQYS